MRQAHSLLPKDDPILRVLSFHYAFEESALSHGERCRSHAWSAHTVFSTFCAVPTSQLPLPKVVKRPESTAALWRVLVFVESALRPDSRSDMP